MSSHLAEESLYTVYIMLRICSDKSAEPNIVSKCLRLPEEVFAEAEGAAS